jgi:hypothetical protein
MIIFLLLFLNICFFFKSTNFNVDGYPEKDLKQYLNVEYKYSLVYLSA